MRFDITGNNIFKNVTLFHNITVFADGKKVGLGEKKRKLKFIQKSNF